MRKYREAYLAALAATSIIMPLVAAITTASFYLLPDDLFSLPSLSVGWHSIMLGWIAAFIIWLVLALVFAPFTTARHADARQYSMLMSRLGVLQKHLEFEKAALHTAGQKDAYYKASFCKEYVENSLNSGPGLRWILGKEYLNLWRVIHHAHEAQIDFECRAQVIQDAVHDLWSIEDSSMPKSDQDELRDRIKQAVRTLDPTALHYLYQEDSKELLKEQLRQVEVQLHQASPLQKTEQLSAKNPTEGYSYIKKWWSRAKTHENHARLVEPPSLSVVVLTEDDTQLKDSGTQVERDALAVLREVRRQLFGFRDSYWENLLSLRNQLIRAFVLTTLGTYLLLCLAVLGLPLLTGKSILLDALALYAVGALAGLYGRFFGIAELKALPQDYGLSMTSLLTTPFFSGLAGLGGVFVTTVLIVLKGSPTVPELLDIFSPLSAFHLLIAAVFGLAPDLLMRSLKAQGETQKSET